MLRIFFSLLLMSGSASAATMGYYTPGGAPCNGACGYDWAVGEFKVPVGEPKRMMMEAGSIVVKMSYAKDGVPYAMSYSAILADDQFGEGYEFVTEDGQRLFMFKLDACQNWAVFAPALPIVEAYVPAPEQHWTPVDVLPVVWVPPVVPWVSEPPPVVVVPPVPLPAAAWMLLSGLVLLISMKGKKHV